MSKVKVALVSGMVVGFVAAGAIGAGAQDGSDDSTAASWVSGEVRYAPSCSFPDISEGDGIQDERTYRCEPQTWLSDDPRLEGEATVTWNADVYAGPDGDARQYSLVSMSWDVRGENGGWYCDKTSLDSGTGLFTTPLQGTDALECTGTGVNEGLAALLIADWAGSPKTFEGLIVPGGLPPMPDPTVE